MREHLQMIAWNIFLLLLAAAILVPLGWMALASISPTGEALAARSSILPSEFTTAHYRRLFDQLNMGRYFWNSLLVSTSVTCLALLLNSLAGYAFAKLRFPLKTALFRTVIAMLVVPAQVAMLPLFLMLRQVHLVNSYWALILPAAASAYGIFLIRQYVLSVPDAMLDAARVDGAHEFRIFFQIVFPTIYPILIALGIFTFLATWNDFMWPLVAMTGDRSYTLPVALSVLSGEHVQDVELMMAGAMVTATPVVLAFLILQKHLIGGIVVGSIKA